MKTKTNILTVSIAAIMAVSAANADIASTTYVNGKITPVENKIDTHAANNDIHVTAEQKTAWSAKQDAISDLATIRSGAALGATALQSVPDATPTVKGVMTKAEAYDQSASSDAKKATAASVAAAEAIAIAKAGQAISALNLGTAYQAKADSTVGTAGTYIAAGSDVKGNLAALDTAAKNAKDAADAAQGTANEAKSAAATNATAIATEKSAREAADTAINNKIGNVTNGKTVVDMINDAQSAATYDDTALAGRVQTIEDSAAYNSGITSALVTQINTNKTNIATNASDIDALETGKQDKITDQNKLSAGLIATSATAQFVSDTEKSTWNAKQGAISDLATIRSNATAGKGAADTIATYGDVVTRNASEFATSAQGGKADTALQKADITTGTSTMANGTISVKGEAVAVKGLGSAAYTASTAYATSAQGAKADSAIQSVTKSGTGNILSDISTTDGAVTVTVSGTAIPKPGTSCSDATNKCVLTYDNTGYTWEVIGR